MVLHLREVCENGVVRQWSSAATVDRRRKLPVPREELLRVWETSGLAWGSGTHLIASTTATITTSTVASTTSYFGRVC